MPVEVKDIRSQLSQDVLSLDVRYPTNMGVIGVFDENISGGFHEAASTLQTMLDQNRFVPAILFLPPDEVKYDHVSTSSGTFLGTRSGYLMSSGLRLTPVTFQSPQPIRCIAGINDENINNLRLIKGTDTTLLDDIETRAIANSKWETKCLLKRAGISTPDGILLSATDFKDGNSLRTAITQIVADFQSDEIAIKPLSELGGEGITLLKITSQNEGLRIAYRAVKLLLEKYNQCIVEKGATRILLRDQQGGRFDFNFRVIGRRSHNPNSPSTEIIHMAARVGRYGTLVNAAQGAKEADPRFLLNWAATSSRYF